MEQTTIETWPGGITTASGGTRTAVKLDRPWQSDIIVNPETCPFCTKPQEWIASFGDEENGWRMKKNDFTPFPFHNLIVPRKCWSKEDLRVLGGEKKIAEAFLFAASVVAEESKRELWLGTHVGALAGQNIGHPHYHLLQPMDSYYGGAGLNPSYVPIFETEDFRVAAGGQRAGQCFIYPKLHLRHPLAFTGEIAPAIAEALSRTILLYNEKFLSKQGLAPDYMIGLKFRNGNFEYCYYLPILNNWGFTEYFAMMEKNPLILPWPHEKTAEHLRS